MLIASSRGLTEIKVTTHTNMLFRNIYEAYNFILSPRSSNTRTNIDLGPVAQTPEISNRHLHAYWDRNKHYSYLCSMLTSVKVCNISWMYYEVEEIKNSMIKQSQQ